MKDGLITAKKAFFEALGKGLGLAVAGLMLSGIALLSTEAIHMIKQIANSKLPLSPFQMVNFLSSLALLASSSIVLWRLLLLRKQAIRLDGILNSNKEPPRFYDGPYISHEGAIWKPRIESCPESLLKGFAFGPDCDVCQIGLVYMYTDQLVAERWKCPECEKRFHFSLGVKKAKEGAIQKAFGAFKKTPEGFKPIK